MARGAAMIQKCNIHNYSIFLKDGLLFSYFAYHGANYDVDMARMAADPQDAGLVEDHGPNAT
jgi:L-rhamnose mutarotase